LTSKIKDLPYGLLFKPITDFLRHEAHMLNNMPSSSERSRFSQRLNDALDNVKFPKLGDGRQSQLAKLLDMAPVDVGSWLKGKAFPATSTLMKLSELTKTRSNWLLSGQGEAYTQSPRGMGKALPATGHGKLSNEAFDVGMQWMKLPVKQREAIALLINDLTERQ
jgi:transcriptional regulator with XRE-family HTH domain